MSLYAPLLLMALPAFGLVFGGSLFLRNGIWLTFWEIYAALFAIAIFERADHRGGMSAGIAYISLVGPMVAAIAISYVWGILRIVTEGSVNLTARRLVLPGVYSLFCGAIGLLLLANL